MAYKIYVSNRLSAWGAVSRIFRPGIYVVGDDRIAAAAADMDDSLVQATECDDAELGTFIMFGPSVPDPGPLTRERVNNPVEPAYRCVDCNMTFATLEAVEIHDQHAHPESAAVAEELVNAGAAPDPSEDAPGDSDAVLDAEPTEPGENGPETGDLPSADAVGQEPASDSATSAEQPPASPKGPGKAKGPN